MKKDHPLSCSRQKPISIFIVEPHRSIQSVDDNCEHANNWIQRPVVSVSIPQEDCFKFKNFDLVFENKEVSNQNQIGQIQSTHPFQKSILFPLHHTRSSTFIFKPHRSHSIGSKSMPNPNITHCNGCHPGTNPLKHFIVKSCAVPAGQTYTA